MPLYKANHNYNGVGEIVLSCLLISIIISMVRHLSVEFHIFFIVFLRNFFSLIFLVPKILKYKTQIFKTKNLYLHLIRGGNGTISMIFWFFAISSIPLSQAVSLSFLTPIITTICSMIFLKEKIVKNIFLSCFICFIGVLIILRPGFNSFQEGYLFSFLSIIFWTISNLIIKNMTKTDSVDTIMINTTFFMLIFSIPLALPYFQALNLFYLIEFLILGLLSNISYRLIISAYSKNDLSFLQPFDFSRLIFTSFIAYFIFNEKLDIWVFIGSFIILLGLLIILKKPTKNNKNLLSNNND